MPRIDFNHVEDAQDYTPIPNDRYLCELAEVEEASTRNGDEMWRLRFRVAEGKYAGRIIFDNLVFSEAALKRVKLICSRLGLDVSGELELTPETLRGRRCYVSVETEGYMDAEGKSRQRNTVPYAGYQRIGGAPGEGTPGQGTPGAAKPGTPAAPPSQTQQAGAEDDGEEHLIF